MPVSPGPLLLLLRGTWEEGALRSPDSGGCWGVLSCSLSLRLPFPHPVPSLLPLGHKDDCLRLAHKESPCLGHNVGVWQGKTEALWFLAPS